MQKKKPTFGFDDSYATRLPSINGGECLGLGQRSRAAAARGAWNPTWWRHPPAVENPTLTVGVSSICHVSCRTLNLSNPYDHHFRGPLNCSIDDKWDAHHRLRLELATLPPILWAPTYLMHSQYSKQSKPELLKSDYICQSDDCNLQLDSYFLFN